MSKSFSPKCKDCSVKLKQPIYYELATFDTLRCPQCGNILVLDISLVRASATIEKLQESLKAQEAELTKTKEESSVAETQLKEEKRKFDDLRKSLGLTEKDFKSAKQGIDEELNDWEKEPAPDERIKDLAWKGETKSHDIKKAQNELKNQKLALAEAEKIYKKKRDEMQKAERLYKSIKDNIKRAEKEESKTPKEESRVYAFEESMQDFDEDDLGEPYF